MLRYLEQTGLVEPRRTPAKYRLYTQQQLERLRSLRDLLARFGVGPSDVAFAKRLREDPPLAAAIAQWLEPGPTYDWLRFEQAKSLRLLAAA